MNADMIRLLSEGSWGFAPFHAVDYTTQICLNKQSPEGEGNVDPGD
jgi:hypothetical protein